MPSPSMAVEVAMSHGRFYMGKCTANSRLRQFPRSKAVHPLYGIGGLPDWEYCCSPVRRVTKL
jgi:hypothetical protein